MIQPADVLVENSIAFFIRNGFLIYTKIENNQNYMLMQTWQTTEEEVQFYLRYLNYNTIL